MAELTVLDEKLAEVLGLAQAAQVATRKVMTLARTEQETELVQLMRQMSEAEQAMFEILKRYTAEKRTGLWNKLMLSMIKRRSSRDQISNGLSRSVLRDLCQKFSALFRPEVEFLAIEGRYGVSVTYRPL